MLDSIKFHDKVNRLCQERGMTITQFTVSIGLSNSTATNWKNGNFPNATTVKLIADKLNVSTDYLLSEDEVTKTMPLDDLQVRLLRMFNQLNEQEKYVYIGRLEAYLELRNENKQ